MELVVHDPMEIAELHAIVVEHLRDAKGTRVWHLESLEVGLPDENSVARLQLEVEVP